MKNAGAEVRMKWLLMAIGLSLLTTRPAAAVVGNVSLISAGEPVAQATISFQTTDGQVVAEGETDDDGKVALLIPDSHKGQTLIVVGSKGDRTTRQSVAVDRDDLKIALSLPDVGVGGARDGFEFSIGVSGLYKWANFDGAHNYVSEGLSKSGDLDSSSAGVGADLQVRPPSNFLGGLPLFLALGFGLPCNIDEDGAHADYHPTAGLDSHLSVEERWFLRMMLGYEILAIQQLQIALLGGVQFTDVDATLTADETGGGGVVNRFRDSETMISPVLGLGVSHPINNTKAYVFAAFYLAWMDDISGDGTSSLGLNYSYDVDGGVQSEIQVGVRIPFK